MPAEFVGQILLQVLGVPVIHVKSAKRRSRTGRRLVKGMSPDSAPIGRTGGTKEHEFDLELYVPRTGDPIPWLELDGAVLTFMPRGGGETSIYTGGFTTEEGVTYDEDGAAMRSVSMQFKRKVA